MRRVRMTIFICTLLLLSACNDSNENSDEVVSPAPISTLQINSGQAKIVKDVEEKALENKAIYDAVAINGDKEIMLAVKVKQFYRFGLKGIEKKVLKQLKRAYPTYEIIVSTDKKIFWEIEKVNEKKEKKQIKKEIKRLIKLSKDKA